MKLLEIFFPNKCKLCSRLLDSVNSFITICDDCERKIEYLNKIDISNSVPDKDKYGLDRVMCLCRYSGLIRKSVIAMKYGERPENGACFGKLMYRELIKYYSVNEYDLICMVPSSRGKIKERGYNQAEIIAKELARNLNIRFESDVLIKQTETISQSLLNAEERMRSISGAYAFSNKINIKDLKILLIDDILTTGATILRCAKILKDSGAASVTAYVLATGKNNI